ncbi:MAG: ATP-binding cassette domain-containing protein [Spirochaetes bacterium]|nr:ATP-binding cassette domain-containing protein [Spirochaetota bacterium]
MFNIEVNNLTFNYDINLIFENLSASFNENETFVLLGRAGCGMTTLLKIIAGLIYFNKGSISIGGKKLENFTKEQILEYHKVTGFVFQQSGLISNMSIMDNLSLYMTYHTRFNKEIVNEIVLNIAKKFEIEKYLNLRPANLSISNVKLVNIARAVIHDPIFLFMDEPDSNLDNISISNIINIIRELKNKSKLIIISTHNFNFAKAIGDKIGVISEGKISEIFLPDEIGKIESRFIKKLIE